MTAARWPNVAAFDNEQASRPKPWRPTPDEAWTWIEHAANAMEALGYGTPFARHSAFVRHYVHLAASGFRYGRRWSKEERSSFMGGQARLMTDYLNENEQDRANGKEAWDDVQIRYVTFVRDMLVLTLRAGMRQGSWDEPWLHAKVRHMLGAKPGERMADLMGRVCKADAAVREVLGAREGETTVEAARRLGAALHDGEPLIESAEKLWEDLLSESEAHQTTKDTHAEELSLYAEDVAALERDLASVRAALDACPLCRVRRVLADVVAVGLGAVLHKALEWRSK